MSILIRGAKMPKNCNECALDDVGDKVCCDKWRDFVYRAVDKPMDCPLVEVSTPHGRLIDADKVIDDIERSRAFHGDALLILRDILNDAPTVIEAEE